MLEQLILDTRRYAKRQMTWFSANKELRWFQRDEYELMANEIAQKFSQRTATGTKKLLLF
jgi:tRNA A37 N6-isopentenylltransferase MiaA